MIPLPSADALAISGMAFVVLYAAYVTQVRPRIARHRDPHST